MNIVILSGGSGNDALVKGIKSFYKDANVKVIINAYDSGKSTGICRKVTNTLGVSDIRKNHIRMYKASNEHYDKRIEEFMEARYNFTSGDVCKEVCEMLDRWGLSQFNRYAKAFFANKMSKMFNYYDFNVANIIYSQMFAQLGYEKTNKIMCDLMGIEDFVKLNSFDNVYINAVTKNGNVLEDEGDIVEYKCAGDPIVEIKYMTNDNNGLNPDAIETLNKANLLIVSTGTFWSSIYPTLFYKDFYQYVNQLKCKKIWLMNNEQDKDSYGVTSNDFIDIMVRKGLNLKEFTILENLDACESLRVPNEEYNVIQKHMGNIKGKHDPNLFVKEVLKAYYGIEELDAYDNVIFDFDDTIWARDEKDVDISIDNLKYINEKLADKSFIISGNSFESIKPKLYKVFGTDLKNMNIDIWADANAILYQHGLPKDMVQDLSINGEVEKIHTLLTHYGLPFTEYGEDAVNVKVKPVADRERTILVDLLNFWGFGAWQINGCKAIKAGTTTVDIVSKDNDKSCIYKHLNLRNNKTLYVGDEIDSGNDRIIAQYCTASVQTSGVKETNMFLKLFAI